MFKSIGNKSQLFATIDNHKITIVKGELNQRISESYTGHFTITTDVKFKPDEMMGKKMMVSMDANNQTHYTHGIVTQAKTSAGNKNTFIVTIESPLSLMAKRHQSRSFTDAGLKAIIKDILSEHAFSRTGIQFRLKADDDHPYYEQHQTTDLAFFQRIMAEEGLAYYFKPNESSVSICIDDQFETDQSVTEFPYSPELEPNNHAFRINTLHQTQQTRFSGVQLHGYDIQSPSMAMQVQTKMPNLSLMEMKPTNETQLKKTQQLRLDALNAQADTTTLTTNIPSLIPGVVFALTKHPDTQYNRHYRVINSVQTWDETGADSRYQNEVVVVPITVATRPSYDAVKHAVPHLSLASVKGEGTRANLTTRGEYFVNPLDMTQSETPQAPVRQAQAFVGNGYGMHFPLLDNTEVVMARVNGHPDKPVILGALYNESNANPVSGSNPYLNVIKTESGNAFMMNDTPNYRSIALQTAQEENQFILDANMYKPDIQLSSKTGGLTLQAAGASSWSTQGNATLTAADAMLLSAKSMTLSTTTESMQLSSGGNFNLAGNDLLINVAENVTTTILGNFSHTVTDDHELVCDGKLALTAATGDMQLQSSQGAMTLLAQKGTITLEIGNTNLQFDDKGNCVMRANKITLHAMEINMQNAGAVAVS